jgi:hydrogenase expression/formation protein HypE
MHNLPKAYRIKGVLFDFDGTLTRPGTIDFTAIRDAIGCPAEQTILEFIQALSDPDQRRRARAELHRMEMAAARDSQPNPGAEALIRHLKDRGLPLGILTRNSRAAVAAALDNFPRTRLEDFNIVITRDDPIRPKPSPDGVRQAARRFKIDPGEILLVGDFHLDIEAGRRAGALTALLDYGAQGQVKPDTVCDFKVKDLAAVGDIVRQGLPLPPGKFPAEMLEEIFGRLRPADESLLVTPGIGEDTAALRLDGGDTLVITSDPITFVTERIGHYAVLVNANDIATSGAQPRWLMTTLLFPPGTTASEIGLVMHDIDASCARWNITLCGGHTEISDAVARPVVVGTLCATLERRDLITKQAMRSGDHVLLTKGVAVEGTAIIAREFAGRLRKLGLDEELIVRSQELVAQISILTEAAVARGNPGVSAMHDVTEGGLATALTEFSIAGGHRLGIDMALIPVLAPTRTICRLLGIDPLGLIGSGSLLLTCRPAAGPAIMKEMQRAGVDVTVIGEVRDAGSGIEARVGQASAVWPYFEVDELTRLF